MTLYNFIFSNKRSTKIARHASFWLLWWLVYSLIGTIRRVEFQNYSWWEASWLSGFEMLLQIPIDMLFCYYIIYFLIPRFLEQDKLGLFFIYWISGIVFIAVIQYYYAHYVVLHIRGLLGKPVPRQPGLFLSVLSNSLSFNITAGFATSIRLIKKTIFQKKESSLLLQELELLRKKQDGEDLFNDTFVSRIIKGIETSPRKAGSYLKEVNDLVMYLSFECKKKSIPVTSEVSALISFVNIQNSIRSRKYELSIRQNIRQDSRIASFLFIPIADTLMRIEDHGVPSRLEIDVREENDELTYTITYETPDSHVIELTNDDLFLLDRKLQILYPQGYRLNKLIGKSHVSLVLQLKLGKLVYQ